MKKSLLLSFILILVHNTWADRQRIMDSLKRVSETATDTIRVKALNDLSIEYSRQTYYILAEKAGMEALKIAQRINYTRGIANANYYIGISFARRTKFDKAAEFYLKARENFEKSGDKKGMAYTIMLNGVLDYYQKKSNAAAENYQKAMKIFEVLKDTLGMANCLVNLGLIHYEKQSFDEAIKLSEKAYSMFGKSLHGKAEALSIQADIYTSLFQKNDSTGNKTASHMYFQKAVDIYRNNLMVYKDLNQINDMAGQYINLNEIYFHATDYATSKRYLDSAYNLIKESDNYNNLSIIYKNYYLWHQKCGDIKSALDNYILYTAANDSLFNSKQAEKLESFNVQLAELEKQKEINDLSKEKEKQKIYLWSILFIAILAVALSLLYYYRFREKQNSNRILSEKNSLIEEKNKEITDSINYARRIQQALLPSSEIIRQKFADAFIVYNPKDIVSGDFYWFAESDKNKIIAVADCTGHGVPGGFMSMLGFEILQDVLLKENITTTNEALKILDNKITQTLNSSVKNVRDGMEMVLCAFSKNDKVVLFSGANRSLIQVSKGKLTEYEPDKSTLGGNVEGYDKSYTQHEITFSKGDVFYLITDGYADQFGGPNQKKYMSKRLKALLLSISDKPMSEQEKTLQQTFQEWKGNLEQVDDVTIVGIRV